MFLLLTQLMEMVRENTPPRAMIVTKTVTIATTGPCDVVTISSANNLLSGPVLDSHMGPGSNSERGFGFFLKTQCVDVRSLHTHHPNQNKNY